jgi:hypothetical protein
VARAVLCTLLPAALLHARLLASIVHWPCRWAGAAWPTGGDKVIAQHIAEAMKAKYPQANFAAYFAFLGRCRPRGKTQKHHIAPRSLWPELADDKQNLIPLTVPQHKKAHAILAKQIPDASWPCPKFIAAPSTPEWIAAHYKRINSPQWLAAVITASHAAMRNPAWHVALCTAMRKLTADPRWRAAQYVASCAANRKMTTDPKWLVAARAGFVNNSLTGRPLPLKKIIAMYQSGVAVRQIAIAIGYPPRHGQNRIADALIRAGVYKGRRTAKWQAMAEQSALVSALLPLKEIVALYQRGTSVRQIAMAIGNPPNRGQNRIVSALVRAGVYRGKR